MIEEVSIKSHLIVTNTHHEYSINWCGRIIDTNPIIKNGKPVFVIIGSQSRVEMNTFDMEQIEKCAKNMTHPKGRASITTDQALIYIKEVGNKETLIGIVTHNYVKEYAPMFDKVGYGRIV